MPDQPRKKPDDDYEVVDPPPAKLPVARPVKRRPEPVADDDDDDFEEVPRRKKVLPPHWFFRYVVNVRGAIALAVLVSLLTAARVAMWLTTPAKTSPTPGIKAASGVRAQSAASNQVGRVAPEAKPGDWVEFADPKGWFSLWLPPGATQADEPADRGASLDEGPSPRAFRWHAGDVTYRLYTAYESYSSDGAIMGVAIRPHVAVTDWPFGYEMNLRVQEMITVGGRRAAAGSYLSKDGQRWMHTRGFTAGKRGYALYVSSPKVGEDTDPQVAPFFDGFRITPKGENPPAEPKQTGRPKKG